MISNKFESKEIYVLRFSTTLSCPLKCHILGSVTSNIFNDGYKMKYNRFRGSITPAEVF